MSEATAEVTLQINLIPSDLPHAEHILRHQLRQLASQVSEILFVVDANKGRGPRFARWPEGLTELRRLLDDCCAAYAHAAVIDVDYSAAATDDLSSALFCGRRVPPHDWKGNALYPYFFALHKARHNYVFHMDSDIMLGGGSKTWTAEAVAILQRRPEVLACNPLPGPPTADGRLRSQELAREPGAALAFKADSLSSRLFLIDRGRLYSRVGVLPLTRPRRHRVCQAIAEGWPPYDLAEVMLSRAMQGRGLVRVDFLGTAPGMWSLHPSYRSRLFYDSLPRLIAQIEGGDIPETQRGCHDINDGLIDWSGAKRSLASRLRRHADLVLSNMAEIVRRVHNAP
jgi:hypothetical protein